jgi:hypothetical protein
VKGHCKRDGALRRTKATLQEVEKHGDISVLGGSKLVRLLQDNVGATMVTLIDAGEFLLIG